jgi:hypothetical protein
MNLFRRIDLWLSRGIAIRARLAAGQCPELSPRGFICTVTAPHREHIATALPDHHEVDRWISAKDRA